MSCSTTIFEVYVPKQMVVSGGTVAAAINLSAEAPTAYKVGTDVTETASTVVTTTVLSRTAEGEVPQQQCVIESQGGGDIGESAVAPGIEVTTSTVVSGADTDVGVGGTSNI